MKRVIKLHADGGCASVRIVASVSTDHSFTRDEVNSMCADLASKLMEQLPEVRFLYTPLARIKVSGV